MSEKYTVTRNGVVKELSTFKIIRGDNKDKEYPAPQFAADTWEQDAKWLGIDTLLGIAQTFVKRAAQELWLDNVKEDGTIDVPKFLQELSDFTSASMKLADLKERYDELVAKQGMLVDKLDDTPTPEELKAIKDLRVAIQVVKAQMDTKSRKTKPETNAEAAVAV